MKRESLRVAISGAGVAGPALAYWLLRSGHRPTLIEQSPEFRTGGYMVNFWGPGYQVAQRMGIEGALQDAGYRVQRLDAVDERGQVGASIQIDAFENLAGGRCTSLPRGDLAAAVFATVDGHCEAIFGDSIGSIQDGGDGLALTLRSGGLRRFDLLVGADGLHSNVRRLVFGPDRDFERPLGCRVAACVVEGYRPRTERTYVTHDVPGRHVARFTLRGDRTLFLFVFRVGDDRDPGSLDARKALLRDLYADVGWECPRILDAVDAVRDLYFDVVSQVRMPAWSCGRVALIGDAAASVSLLGGEGTGLALTEAYVLAGELARTGGDHRRAFQAYERLLRPYIEREQAAARELIAYVAVERDVGVRAMHQPWLNGLIAGRAAHQEFTLPDYGMAAQAEPSTDANPVG